MAAVLCERKGRAKVQSGVDGAGLIGELMRGRWGLGMTAKPVALSVAAIAALAFTAFGWAGTAAAQSAGERSINRSDLAARAQAEPKRARTRIRVTPRCPYRLESVAFPVPYECEYPGPGYVRQCVAQLVPEYRPSGNVIVPVTRCWWERG